MPEVPENVSDLDAGERGAEQLLPLVYTELRRLAAARLAQERPGQTLTATALVHEAYVRLMGARSASKGDAESLARAAGSHQFANRAHFFGAAAEAMRRILIERARQKRGPKLGGGRKRVDLTDAVAAAEESPDALLDLDDALTKLAGEDATAAEVVKLRVFAGVSVEEAAEALGLSRAAAYRHWKYARAWLEDALGEKGESVSKSEFSGN
jgi:RNA polymerase sigma factor (TIGR02999 family)